MGVDVKRPVGALVAERLSRATVFDRLGIDYCCHGQTPLEEACRRNGLRPDDVLAAIALADVSPGQPDEADYAEMPLTPLADHIEETHHAFMKRELPRLERLLAKVRAAHADRHPELNELVTVYAAFKEEIDSHLMKEERVLFPIIRELEAATRLPSFHCGSVRNPIRVMEHEHTTAGSALTRMRALTDGFTPPADGCTSYQALMGGLEAVEADLHRHIHKENNILFPRAAALEERMASG